MQKWLGSRAAVVMGVAGSHSSHLPPRLGTSMCRGCGPKKPKKKKKKRNSSYSNIYMQNHGEVGKHQSVALGRLSAASTEQWWECLSFQWHSLQPSGCPEGIMKIQGLCWVVTALISRLNRRKRIGGESSQSKCQELCPAAFTRFCTEIVWLMVGGGSWRLSASLPTPTSP